MRATEFIAEIDRRGFLGALGAGAMSAAGVPAEAKPKQPEPTAFLSAHIEAEEMLHKTALRAGMRGAELAQFMAVAAQVDNGTLELQLLVAQAAVAQAAVVVVVDKQQEQ